MPGAAFCRIIGGKGDRHGRAYRPLPRGGAAAAGVVLRRQSRMSETPEKTMTPRERLILAGIKVIEENGVSGFAG